MLEIYLVRHGLTLWNAEKRFQGSKDVSLSEEGIKQAMKVRDRLKELKFDAIYSSDLKRAFRTAEIIAEPHVMDVIPVKEIREINMGDWEGLTWDEIARDYVDIHRAWTERPTMAAIPNSEGVIKANQRAFKAFNELTTKHKDDQRILIVSHGLINATILCRIEEINLDDWFNMHQNNTAVNIIEYAQKEFKPVLVNCTKHLQL